MDNPLEVLNAGFHGPRTEPLQILRLNTLPVFRPRRGAVAPSRPAEEGRLNIAPAATDIRSRVEAATRIASDPITVRVPVAYRVPAHHIPSCTSSADCEDGFTTNRVNAGTFASCRWWAEVDGLRA
ncbi:hypothetical protein CEJ39_01425 [Rhodococcus pyridinivorans]|uniref:Uncharacterized protein n=2 Tax=Rhodococcus pyridinivorans TaxID=103816 RepID=A0A7M2XVK6_9NOCA|nr:MULTISPECIES: hypothetical protein [Rhodococcus]AWZ23010.1 hypothetical protein CEJ39_01425 [Rhodococcus pyridinivorans]EHK80994.1 hypothetical protein AK37_21801 [Rhodococcus pyridinivorans AK37]MBX4170837.1 hypothetical protein [Rhodococcus sp. DMU2021]MCD2140887.1 hypothetical protein [Rhodococcus pyridinivorans]QOW01799.1 hypothetical protein INP59_26005 [Rhodococcus pyridinivorans]